MYTSALSVGRGRIDRLGPREKTTGCGQEAEEKNTEQMLQVGRFHDATEPTQNGACKIYFQDGLASNLAFELGDILTLRCRQYLVSPVLDQGGGAHHHGLAALPLPVA